MIKSRHLRQGFYREGSWRSPFFIVTLGAIVKEGLHIRKFMGFTGTEDDLAIPKVSFQRNLAKKITVWMQNCHYIRSGFKVGIYDCCGDPDPQGSKNWSVTEFDIHGRYFKSKTWLLLWSMVSSLSKTEESIYRCINQGFWDSECKVIKGNQGSHWKLSI